MNPMDSHALLNQIEGRVTRGHREGKVYVFGNASCLNVEKIAAQSRKIHDLYDEWKTQEPKRVQTFRKNLDF